MDISPELLSSELHKARKRLLEQATVLAACKEIIGSAVALPSLKTIAARRLPKLQQVHDETVRVIAELEAALKTGKQLDLVDTKPTKK